MTNQQVNKSIKVIVKKFNVSIEFFFTYGLALKVNSTVNTQQVYVLFLFLLSLPSFFFIFLSSKFMCLLFEHLLFFPIRQILQIHLLKNSNNYTIVVYSPHDHETHVN